MQLWRCRAAAYLVSAGLASVVHVGWLVVVGFMIPPRTSLGLAVFVYFANGFFATLLLLVLPWAIAVWASRRLRWPLRVLFPVFGALFVLVIGCAASSISFRPLWIEDQTFLQGALIAAERQGFALLISGGILGASYWFLSERDLRPL